MDGFWTLAVSTCCLFSLQQKQRRNVLFSFKNETATNLKFCIIYKVYLKVNPITGNSCWFLRKKFKLLLDELTSSSFTSHFFSIKFQLMISVYSLKNRVHNLIKTKKENIELFERKKRLKEWKKEWKTKNLHSLLLHVLKFLLQTQ